MAVGEREVRGKGMGGWRGGGMLKKGEKRDKTQLKEKPHEINNRLKEGTAWRS